jgi:translation initiation factor IF-2
MGHVDHGKTSLLDYIRRSKITSGEAGGITQHIGAYHVESDRGVITFIDTPGQAAFTSMRERGAMATDIVILVVAADDGVMPQTVEAVQHAKAAGVPIIVAVNKIDKEEADPDRVKTELGNHQVIPEEWGGENIFVNVSAVTGQGVDELLDAISLQAELLELRAASEGRAKGVVLESSLDKGRGVTTTVLVQEGTLNKGDILLAGDEFGRVRAMFDENGEPAEKAGPSIPVAVIGLSATPSAGDEVRVVEDERTAREVATSRRTKQRDKRLASQQQAKLDSLFEQMKLGEVNTLNVLLKADVQGTLEAIRDALTKLAADSEEVDVSIVGSGVGGINETDISLAAASNAIVIGFNVRADASARRAAAERGVDLNYYSIIYELIDDVKSALVGMLAPEYREQIIGLAEVKDVFKSPQFGAVAGSIVTEGVIRRNQPIRVLRDNVVIYEGELESLRRFKDDVQEVKSGTECGIAVKNYNDVKIGDQIEVYERIKKERTL